MTRSDWGLIAALSVIWGGAFFFIEVGLRGFPPVSLSFWRMALAAVPLLLLLHFRGEALPRGAAIWGAFAILSLLNIVVPFILFMWAQLAISAGLASVLNATTPLWGVIVAHFLTRDEKATPARVVGVLLGIAGVTTMIGYDTLRGLGDDMLPQLACVVATLCYALAAVYARRFAPLGFSPLVISTGQVVASALILLPVMLAFDRPWLLPIPGADAMLAVTGLALVSTSFAYILYFRLLASAGATNSLLVTFLIPITAILLGITFLGEALSPRELAGMALIALGLAALDGRPFAMLARRPAVP